MSDERDELPDGWEWLTIGDVCDTTSGGTPSRQKAEYFGGNIPWVKSGELEDTTITTAEETITKKGLQNSSAKIFPAGTLLVALYGATVGRTGLLSIDAATNQAVCALFPKDSRVDKNYLWLYLRGQRKNLIDVSTGGAQPNISQKVIREWSLPLPPLPEQQRIVEKIEKLFAESRTACEALDAVPSLLKRFRQSVLAKAFRGELVEHDPNDEPASVLLERIKAEREKKKVAGKKYIEPTPIDTSELPQLPEGWEWVSMGEVFNVHTGGTPSRKKPEYWNGKILWVSSGEVAFRRIKTTRESITRLGLENSSTKLHPVGTVLLGMIGEGKTRGQCAILDVPATNNQNSAAIVVPETPIPSEYVFYWLMSRYDETRDGGEGGAQPALNGEKVKRIPLPLAPLAEQRRIVAKIESLFAQADAIKQAVEVARRRAQQIDQAILARAFRGGM